MTKEAERLRPPSPMQESSRPGGGAKLLMLKYMLYRGLGPERRQVAMAGVHDGARRAAWRSAVSRAVASARAARSEGEPIALLGASRA